MQTLKDFPITHGYVHPVTHPSFGIQVNGQSAVRYMRFLRPARLHHLELKRAVYGRWTPNVPTHPAHLIISTLDRSTLHWRVLKEVDLPYDPRVAGEGLNAQTTPEKAQSHFAEILNSPPYVIELDGVETDHLRVECDREHPVWPNHGEVNGNIINVPYGTLNPLKAYGELFGEPLEMTAYHPMLRRGKINPAAPDGMHIREYPEKVVFESKHLSIGFALGRPILLQMGWDALGKGRASENRHCLKYSNVINFGGPSGPVLRTLNTEYVGRLWTGEISVKNNKVMYRNLHAVEGLTLDAIFTVEPDRVFLELTQRCERPIPVLEYETWRWMWNEKMGITAAAAEPTLLPGRNGDVKFPFMWATDGVGCLSCRIVEGSAEQVRAQIESFNDPGLVTGGIALINRQKPDECLVVPAGTRRTVIELAVSNLQPNIVDGKRKSSMGIQRQWATMFSCFRPEFGGFSNNAVSCNCLPGSEAGALIAINTKRPGNGPDPLNLARFTIERAILGGGGYGYWRNLYMEVDPAVVCAAGLFHQARRDMDWLRKIEPGLMLAIDRMAATIGPEGLMVCKDLSGNSGSYRWSSNMMDVVGFGHIDGYSNAFGYRAFRNAAVMLADLGHKEKAERYRVLAEKLKASYAAHLVNPETGWIAGWRSRDGQLHDYAFIFVNGPAIAFGLLDDETARRALRGLENLRIKIGQSNARMGLPANLLPIRKEDHLLWQIRGEILPTFETYTDGAMMSSAATYYLRALSRYGFKPEARHLAAEIDQGYAEGLFSGGQGSGVEFHSWEGLPNGYEGTLIWNFSALYSVAIEKGLIRPPDPEWWPAD